MHNLLTEIFGRYFSPTPKSKQILRQITLNLKPSVSASSLGFTCSLKALAEEAKARYQDVIFKIFDLLYPSCILVLLLENPLIIFGRYRKDFPSTIQLKGVLADMRNFSIELKVQEAKDIPPDKEFVLIS
ncbi:uncharacterized protein LOC141679399 isoform X2 [Apium graveolens]|uniref:uncharacterized protein LOC141679399 isoform X2 n=1 Tax=Apium graveolens TaxID=4045 RepID=UPI003D7A1FDE